MMFRVLESPDALAERLADGREFDSPSQRLQWAAEIAAKMRRAVIGEKLVGEMNQTRGAFNFGGINAAVDCPDCGQIHLLSDVDGIFWLRGTLDPQLKPENACEQGLFLVDKSRPVFTAVAGPDGKMIVRACGDFTKAQMERIEEAARRYLEQVKGER